VLCDVGAYPQGVIATTLGIDRTTMVALVDDLERRGWVERRRDSDDRRRYTVNVTDAGRKGRDELLELVQGCEDDLLGPLDASERDTLRSLLQRVGGGGPCPPAE
jgi:DNA-binding MarR family transcriptional regulator